ncbi:Eos1 protein [Martiniozyma asiatica (nom. inval.)]|nr:Eos1 protein [Martiniozyma asiatica]
MMDPPRYSLHWDRKTKVLKRLPTHIHMILTICRDIPIYLMLKHYFVLVSQWYELIAKDYKSVTTVRATEYFLASLWCLVCILLSYLVLDALMTRWLSMYAVQATIVRLLSMSLFIVATTEWVNHTFNTSENGFSLTVWILVACLLTLVFIFQSVFDRKVDIKQVVVFAVVPIGVASFVSTVCLVRIVVILRLEVLMEMGKVT